MVDTSPPSVSAASADASAPPAQLAVQPMNKAWRLAAAALIVALLAGLGVWVLAQKLNKTQAELARRSSDAEQTAQTAQRNAAQAQAQVQSLEARLAATELRLSEVTLQRAQLQELMLSVSRSRDASLLHDIESALRWSIEQSQLTGSVQPLIASLQAADQRIERAAQPKLNPVQRAIARDIERLRTAESVDVPALVARIDELLRAVDDWPLRNGPPPPHGVAAPSSTPAAPAPRTEAAPTAPSDATGWASLPAEYRAWLVQTWQHVWQQTLAGLGKWVRVSHIDNPEAALLAPEQSHWLRQHLRLRLLNVRLALLGRQIDTAQADVQTARQLVQRYFDADALSTRQALHLLGQLQAHIKPVPPARPDATLAALALLQNQR